MCIFIFYNSIWNVRYTGRHNHICPTLFRNQHKEFLRLFDRVLGVESSLWQERSWKHLKYSIMKLIVISRMERITVSAHRVVCHLFNASRWVPKYNVSIGVASSLIKQVFPPSQFMILKLDPKLRKLGSTSRIIFTKHYKSCEKQLDFNRKTWCTKPILFRRLSWDYNENPPINILKKVHL